EVNAGRCFSAQPAGNHCTARSWSVMNRMRFMPDDACVPTVAACAAGTKTFNNGCPAATAPAVAQDFRKARRETWRLAGVDEPDEEEDDARKVGEVLTAGLIEHRPPAVTPFERIRQKF